MTHKSAIYLIYVNKTLKCSTLTEKSIAEHNNRNIFALCFS